MELVLSKVAAPNFVRNELNQRCFCFLKPFQKENLDRTPTFVRNPIDQRFNTNGKM